MTADSPGQRGDLLHRFFAGITEHSFMTRLGVADPPLIDYLTQLLVRFVRNDAIYGLRTPKGERLSQVADMLAEAQARQGSAKRIAHRQIGDFTLFWSGLFPEIAESNRRAGKKDSLLDYRDQGKRNYYLASTLPAAEKSPPAAVLTRLSNHFELCVYGLGEVRKQWEQRDGESDAPLLFG